MEAMHSALLTRREAEIVELLLSGHKSREIAILLNISFETVKTHRKHIFEKTGCTRCAHLYYYLAESNLITA